LCVEFFGSPTGLLTLDLTTQHVRRLVLEATFAEPIAPGDPLTFGELRLADFTAKAVRVLRDRKQAVPEAANVRVKAIRRVFKWAIEEEIGGVTVNPARDVSKLEPKRKGGHRGWAVEEIEKYEERHPIGTKAHLAMTLLLYCGGRRGDVVTLGKQHARNGRLRYTQEKNRSRNPVVVDIAMPAELQRVLDASEAAGITGDLAFLVNEYRHPFAKAGFGNKFRDWCVQAGVPGRAHGLRKAAAVRVANNRATVDQMKAIFGWRSNKMAELYVAEADRARLGSDAPDLLAKPTGQAKG
jgi:integrase